MSRTRIVGGNITRTTGGNYRIFSDDNIEIHSNKMIIQTGEENGISFGRPEEPPFLKLENGVDIFAEFRVLNSFNGEFGFDWIEWDDKDEITKIQDVDVANFEYMFDNSKKEYIAVSTDASLKNKIKDEYKKHQINHPYYIPWLNIFPNQGEIKLNMIIKPIITGQDITKEIITFEKSDSYQITIDGQTNENIKYSPNATPKEITIKCLKPSAEINIIAKNEKGNIVGKIRVKDNKSTYNLPIRLVCVVKKSATKDTEITQLISDFNSDKIEEYLNKNSLNQALIKTTIEIDSKYQICFDENEWSGKFYDKTNDWFTNRKIAGAKVNYTDDDGQEIKNADNEHILDKFLRDYKKTFEPDGKKFKGILLFISNIQKDPSDKEGGVSRTKPVNFREAIVFKKNLKNKNTYAHELAHALGLEHYFWRDTEYKQELIDQKNSINTNNIAISSRENNIKINENNIKIYDNNIKEYEEYQKTHPNYYKDNPTIDSFVKEQKKGKLNAKNEIKKLKEEIENIKKIVKNGYNNLNVYKNNKYKFKESSNLNIMDYTGQKKTYTQWQWNIMQNDVKSYYGNITENK